MLISHKHKFIIIDIPKTGSRSLRETLIPLGVVDIVGKPPHRKEGWQKENFFQHTTIKQVKNEFEKLGLNINEYFKYSRVRNPWKRLASIVFYTIQKAEQYKELAINKDKQTHYDIMNDVKQKAEEHGERVSGCVVRDVNALKKSYDEWISCGKNLQKLLEKRINHWPKQSNFLLDDDKDIMDTIDRFEDFDNSFQNFCTTIGINPIPKLTHGNKGKYNIPWRDIYTQELIDRVAEKEKWVIDKFGYTF